MSNQIVRRTFAMLALAAATAGAQQTSRDRGAEVDLTLGRHVVSGGLIDFRDGAMADVLISGAFTTAPRWSLVGAIGGGGVVGGMGDRCLLRPGGGCAPQANFVTADLLIGPEI